MAEMVGDGDEVVFGIFGGGKISPLDFGGFFLSSFPSLWPCVQKAIYASGSPVVFLASFIYRLGTAATCDALVCASVDCGGRSGGRPCRTSDVIHGPDVSWLGAFEWIWVGAGLMSAATCAAWLGLSSWALAWRKGVATGDAQDESTD